MILHRRWAAYFYSTHILHPRVVAASMHVEGVKYMFVCYHLPHSRDRVGDHQVQDILNQISSLIDKFRDHVFVLFGEMVRGEFESPPAMALHRGRAFSGTPRSKRSS